jgi:hypothetical protein
VLHHSLGQHIHKLLLGDLGGVEHGTAGLKGQEGTLIDGLVDQLADCLVTKQGAAV